MTPSELLTEAFSRIPAVARSAVHGLSPEQLGERPAAEANSVGWLIWHLTRVQDDHVAEVAGLEQVWRHGWAERLELPYPIGDTGYGHSSADVDAFAIASSQLLLDYLDEVHARTLAFVADLQPEDLDKIVDENWDPPVTLGVRLLSVVSDDLQHAGQAAYVRGLLLG